ncbi:ABC transporter permease [Clostridium sp. CTA-7]
MKSYSEISNRYMKQNKKRTSLTVMGIVLATVLIFAVGTFLLSFRDSMIAEKKRSGGDAEFVLYNITNNQGEKIKNNAEVKDTSIIVDDNTNYKIDGVEKDISISRGNKDYYEKMQTSKILEGRTPINENEVIINTSYKRILNVNVGDEITLKDDSENIKVLKIVGIEEGTSYASDSAIGLMGYFNDTNLEENLDYTLYINLKSKKNKQQIISKIIEENNIDFKNKSDNHELLYLTGNGGNSYVTSSLKKMSIFVIITIMICTIVVIYNSFNISVIERIRYFGILKAIGATPKQIRRIIFKEGFLMGIIALPLGCIIGFLSLKYGVKIFIGDTLMFIEDFKVGFYPSIILGTALLVAITILLSIIGPARKANKISAVDAIRNKNEIKLGKLKRRRGKLVTKIFGIEGNIAYKNIRRTPVRFIVTSLALTISIIIFNVFYGFLDFAKQAVLQQYQYSLYDSALSLSNGEMLKDEQVKELEELSFVRSIYKYYSEGLNFALPVEYVNKDYNAKTNSKEFSENYNALGFVDFGGSRGYIGGDDELKAIERYIVSGSLDLTKLKKNGVILLDGTKVRNENGDVETIRATKYKVGDKIKIPKIDDYSSRLENSINKIEEAIKNGDFYELEIVAIADREPLVGNNLRNGIQLMFHEDLYSRMVKDFKYNTIFFSFNDDVNARNDAVQYFNENSIDKGYSYMDMGEAFNQVESIYKQVEFFVYCFIAIVSIISVVNIFNTISTNLLLRKREFSTLKAIGMTEKQLKKSVLLEGTLYGIIAAIIGGVISAILLAVLIKISAGFAEIKYKFDFIAFGLSIVCAVGVTYIATVFPMNKLKKLTVVEGISEEE